MKSAKVGQVLLMGSAKLESALHQVQARTSRNVAQHELQ